VNIAGYIIVKISAFHQGDVNLVTAGLENPVHCVIGSTEVSVLDCDAPRYGTGAHLLLELILLTVFAGFGSAKTSRT
jgi:hypothetical protein